MSPTILLRTDATLYAACADIWVMYLVAPPRLADMEAATPALAMMRKLCPAGFPTLTWVTAEAGFTMDRDARVSAGNISKAHADVIRAEATLIEAEGFPGAAVRMIIAGLDLLSGTRAPTKVFSHADDAVPWCLGFTGAGAPAAPAVVDALTQLRRGAATAVAVR